MKKIFKDWTTFEKILYFTSVTVTTVISIITRSSYLALINGFCNMTNAILSAKGRISNYYFSLIGNVIYAYISFQSRYYSEVIMSVFLVIPITVYGLASWLRNRKSDDEVRINKLSKRQIIIPILSQVIMSVPYYYLLKYFNSELLIISTFGMCVTILSFYFMAKADPIFNMFFIINGLTRVVMWLIPMLNGDFSNVPLFLSNVVYCVNDAYGLINWTRMAKEQTDS